MYTEANERIGKKFKKKRKKKIQISEKRGTPDKDSKEMDNTNKK